MKIKPFWNGIGEVRVHEETDAIDEIVAHPLQGFHLEQMDDGCWWLGIDGPEGRRISINFVAIGKHIVVTAEDDGEYFEGGISDGWTELERRKKAERYDRKCRRKAK